MNKSDVVIVGTSFAAAFFAAGLMRKHPGTKITFVEWGGENSYPKQVANRQKPPSGGDLHITRTGNMAKTWLFHIGQGGTSNFWWGQTIRLLPDDFHRQPIAEEGVWPISYDDLEPYYCDAEDMIGVATGVNTSLFPRSRPPRHAPHVGNDLDLKLAALYPDTFMICPSARTVEGTEIRPPCCNNGVCGTCPVDAKFRVMNELKALFTHPDVTVLLNHEVMQVDMVGGAARGVIARHEGRDVHVPADLVFLGANAIFNPAILIRSGLGGDGYTGRGIGEQVGKFVDVFTRDVNSYNGTTHITGLSMHGCRADRPVALRYLVENRNSPPLFRFEPGRLLNRARLKIVIESPLSMRNAVEVNGDTVNVHSEQPHPLVHRYISSIQDDFARWIAPVGVERLEFSPHFEATEGHIQCSTRMSIDAAHGVVDGKLRHHRVPGLMVGGASVFSNCAPANPSLTIAALSLRAAAMT